MRRGNKTIIIMFTVMFTAFCVLTVNIFNASVLGKHWRSGADISQYSGTSRKKSLIKSKRGTIYDSSQNIIAEDITSYNLVAYLDSSRLGVGNVPAYVVDVDLTATKLAEILGGDKAYYVSQLTLTEDRKLYQTEFGTAGKGLSLHTKQQIEELGLPGLEFETSTKRHYPLGQFSSQLIGFTDIDQESDSQVGKMGIELFYNDQLNGSDGYEINTITVNGLKLPNTTAEVKHAEDGNDIYLTINRSVQQQLEDSLALTMSYGSTDKAWAVVLEVETGRIIAIGQSPTFDPEVREEVQWTFYPTQFEYEPGSTMKAITYAAALEEGFDPNNTFNSDTAYLQLDGNGKLHRVSQDAKYDNAIQNANGRTWGVIDYKLGFAHSSNVAVVEILLNYLSTDKFEEYLTKFKFFEDLNIEGLKSLPGSKAFNYPIEKITNSFGQGSSVTMMHMAQAYAALLNDGQMIRPYVIDEIVNRNGETVFQGQSEVIGQPVSKETAQKIVDLMAGVVETDGATGVYYRQKDFDVIAKTGTAQIVKDGEYSKTRYISSVAVGFPKNDPKYLVFYVYESDYNDILSNPYSKPINDLVLKIAEEYNLVEQTPSNNNGEVDQVVVSVMPNLINHSFHYAETKLNGSNVEIIKIGEGDNIVSQYPNADAKVVTGQKVMLYTGRGKITMPDMTGWSRKEVTAFWAYSGVLVKIDGYGAVYQQNIPTGTIISDDTEIIVKLK